MDGLSFFMDHILSTNFFFDVIFLNNTTFSSITFLLLSMIFLFPSAFIHNEYTFKGRNYVSNRLPSGVSAVEWSGDHTLRTLI